MANEESTTLQNILAAGKEEFLEKGFKSASLRNIVKTAGVTVDAALQHKGVVAVLVEEHATAIMNIFMSAQEEFEMLDEKDKANHMGIESRKSINSIIDYIYEHFDEFKLIICKSEGTCYENFVHNMVEIEVAETFEFIKILKKQGYDIPDMEKEVCHMIASGMFTGVLELIEHDMKKENAKKYVSTFLDFYIAGWSKILGI